MTRTLFSNGTVFTANSTLPWAESFIVEDTHVIAVGTNEEIAVLADPGTTCIDLKGRLVLPGFTDAHTHILMLGEALGQVYLTDARSLEDIQQLLRQTRAEQPDAKAIWGRGWLFDSVPNGVPTAQMLDSVIPDIPVYLDSNDYHSCWVNTAALRELGITRETPDPLGGTISRGEDGQPNGMLYETAAVQHAWSHRDNSGTDEDRDRAVERVIDAYLSAGVTGIVDMSFNELALESLLRIAQRDGDKLPLRMSAHWLIRNTGDVEKNLAQVRRAAELYSASPSPAVRIAGIKLVLDGVIDACTAAMEQPYADGSNGDLIWPVEDLYPVVTAADAAGMTIAMHAIGDHASTCALDAIENAIDVNGERPRRHRIEHLEYAAPGTAQRMARLGVTASMQPVHADPAIIANWIEMLGDERADRGFAWPEYEDAGALLAFSTDAPTAPHEALANMYVAATRASALDPEIAAVQPQFAIPLERAIIHGTKDAAATVGEGHWRGQIAPEYAADFIILSRNIFEEDETSLLETQVVDTYVGGVSRYSREEAQSQ